VGLKAINTTLDIISLEGKHLGDSNGNQKVNLKVHKKPTMSEKKSVLALIIKLQHQSHHIGPPGTRKAHIRGNVSSGRF
jgi:hypothetical protein